MGKVIKSNIIGELQQDETFSDWWKSSEIEIPFLDNRKLEITFMDFEPEYDSTFIQEADQALTNFLKLTTNDRTTVTAFAFKNYLRFIDVLDFKVIDSRTGEIEDQDDLWKYIQPMGIYVSRRHSGDNDIYVQIACEFDWDQEHGLQFVFRQGKQLTRISEQDGHLTEADAYDKPDSEDELLSKFNSDNL